LLVALQVCFVVGRLIAWRLQLRHDLRSTASHAIVQVDYSGAETSRLKEFEIPS